MGQTLTGEEAEDKKLMENFAVQDRNAEEQMLVDFAKMERNGSYEHLFPDKK